MAIKPYKKLIGYFFLLKIAIFKKLQFEPSYLFDKIFKGFYCHMITTKVLHSYLTFPKQTLYLDFEKTAKFGPKIS